MGLLDQVIGNVLGGVLGGGGHREAPQGSGQGGGLGGALGGGAMSPIVQAILMLLLNRGGGGLGDVLGDVLGGGRRPQDPRGQGPDEDGFGNGPAGDPGAGAPRSDPGGPFGDVFGRRGGGGSDFSDLAGQLDPPGRRDAGAGPYAELDREPGDVQPGREDQAAQEEGGLGGLLERFRRGGHGDLLESWIGGGQNRDIAPNQLADALGADTIDALARRTGVGRDELLAGLSQALPRVVDALTPHGRMPTRAERQGW